MNIFFLDKDPVISADYHCNKHVVKMVTEYAQILSSAAVICGCADPLLYRNVP
jgi:hypothetical protein